MSRKTPNGSQGFSTRAIHVGYDPADAEGALTPPVHLTSTYVFESAEHGAELFAGTRDGYIYGRTKNPTQTILEKRLANLEGGEAALAVCLRHGSHIGDALDAACRRRACDHRSRSVWQQLRAVHQGAHALRRQGNDRRFHQA